MAAPRPWTTAEDAQLQALHGDGKSLHSIAQTMGRGKATIHRKAEALGLTWDRTATANAAAAVAVDNKARRVSIVARVYGRLERTLDRLEAETFKTTLKGDAGRDEIRDLDFVPTADERNLADTMSRLVVIATKLEAVDAGEQGTEQARGILGAFAAAAQAAYDQLPAPGDHTDQPG